MTLTANICLLVCASMAVGTEVATLRQSLGGHLAFAKSAVKPRDSSEWVSSCELQKEECLKQ